MQIVQLNSSATATGKARSTGLNDDFGISLARDAAEVSVKAVAAVPAPALNLSTGLHNWGEGLNGEVANAQQALDFLNQSASQLQSLKTELNAKLTGQQLRDNQLDSTLRQFRTTWDQRETISGGSLSPQLAYRSPALARQRFSVPGLNMQTLQSCGKATLSFSVGGAGKSLRSVTIEPGLSEDEIVRRFDQALAATDIRASKGDGGTLVFSTTEASWISVRDTLSIKGDTIPFPTEQLNRVRTDAEPATIQPAAWQTSGIESMRQTLEQVIQALSRVTQAREAVSRALDLAQNSVDQAEPVDDAKTLANLAENFSNIANQKNYHAFSSINAALLGISRDRVLSLLSLRSP